MKYYSIHFNRPDFIGIQKKYIKDADLIILNNHSNLDIENECKKNNLKCINFDHNMRISPSHSHGYGLNYLKNIIDYEDDYCIIDHDFFPFKNPVFNDYDFISIRNHTSENILHMWPGLIAGRRGTSLKEVNFMPGVLPGGDTGCDTANLLEKNKVKFIDWTPIGLKNSYYLQLSPCLTLAKEFGVHYLNGSNWMPADKNVIAQKNDLLISVLESLK